MRYAQRVSVVSRTCRKLLESGNSAGIRKLAVVGSRPVTNVKKERVIGGEDREPRRSRIDCVPICQHSDAGELKRKDGQSQQAGYRDG